MQISYHSTLIKIKKLQNFKKNLEKRKNFFSVLAGTLGTGRYCLKLVGMASTWPVRPVFKLVRNVNVSILVCNQYGMYRPAWPVPIRYRLPWLREGRSREFEREWGQINVSTIEPWDLRVNMPLALAFLHSISEYIAVLPLTLMDPDPLHFPLKWRGSSTWTRFL